MSLAVAPRIGPEQQVDSLQPEKMLPRAPRTLADTGLPDLFLVELAAKLLLLRGQMRLTEIAQQLRLAGSVIDELLEFMRGERLAELVRRGATPGDVIFALTDLGRLRATEFLRRCRYTGPAPVPIEAYVEQVRTQAAAGMRITRADVERAFEGLVLPGELRDQVGAAMNSGRPMFFYGPPGSGKSFLAECLVRLLRGAIGVPYAFLVDGEIVQVFDPLVHRPVATASEEPAVDARQRPDPRWVLCHRPVVVTGGELRPEMLDLRYDSTAGFYQAPPQVKASNGLFVVDDLGRQIITPAQLMNRWIVPMDRRRDYLGLHSGSSFELPFDVILVFATNLAPSDVADEAFLRRLGYKIHVGPASTEDYAAILRQVCAAYGVPYSDAALAELLAVHRKENRPTLACYPRDLVGLIRDFAIYRGIAPQFDAESIHWAWHNYFASH